MTEPAATYRDAIYQTAPRWLQGPILGKVLYTFGLHLDLLADGAVAAVKKRFPGATGYNDEIEIVGAERGIRRGRNESDEAYAERMREWLDDLAGKGGPYSMLKQLGGFYADAPMVIELVYRSGARFTRALDGTVTRDNIPWLPVPPPAHTWWLIYHWPTAIVDDGNWDDPGTWDDGGLWDYDMTEADAAEARVVPGDWNRGDAFGYIAFLPPGTDTTDIDPSHWNDPTLLSADGVALIRVR